MNVDIECDCGRRGVLLLEDEGGYVRHAAAANCALPPRDIAHPAAGPVPRRGRIMPREASWVPAEVAS